MRPLGLRPLTLNDQKPHLTSYVKSQGQKVGEGCLLLSLVRSKVMLVTSVVSYHDVDFKQSPLKNKIKYHKVNLFTSHTVLVLAIYFLMLPLDHL